MNKSGIISFILSLLFGLGLGISGMTNPQNVIGFLDIFGNWKPALIFVMGAGILFAIPFFYIAKKRDKSIFGENFPNIPTIIDTKLIIGSIAFGIGWGIAGICPGPALVIATHFPKEIGLFLIAMIIGGKIADIKV